MGLDFLLEGGDSSYSFSDFFVSTDGGTNWPVSPIPSPDKINKFWQIASLNDSVVYTLGLPAPTGEAVGLIKSLDGGASWSKITTPGTWEYNYFGIAPQDINIIYLIASYILPTQKSTDGGLTWSSFHSNGARPSGPLAVSPISSEVILVVNNNRLQKQTDSTAITVLTAEAVIEKIVFAPSDPNIVYVASRHYCIYKSTDGGDTFTQVVNLRDYIDSH